MNNLPVAIVVSSVIVAAAVYFSTPRYDIIPAMGSSNAAIWRLDKFSGDISICVTPVGKDTESGCTAKLKQY